MPTSPDPSSADARRHLDDAQALRALAHPVRIALLELLTFDGPMTATQAAPRVGESPSNCSFHLRQLARYGMVEEVPGAGRARPWRVTQQGFTTGPTGQDQDVDAAAGALTDVVIGRATERHRRWQQGPDDGWSDVAGVWQTTWWVTKDEAEELRGEIETLIDRYRERLAHRSERPADARPLEFLTLTHPIDQP